MKSLQWDIFCKVIDNFGDIGVCWRLAADLAARGQRVRIWVDDASALAWMAPHGCDGVEVLAWTNPLGTGALDAAPCGVLIEAFGCEVAPEFIASCARIYEAKGVKPAWINLEYLSAESQAERNHRLPSLVQRGPAAGWTKWFFYPGFTPTTGGLLREPGLAEKQQAFDHTAWLRSKGVSWNGETLVSLFCYEPAALADLLGQLTANGLNGRPVHLLVAAGRAQHAVTALTAATAEFAAEGGKIAKNTCQIALPPNKHGNMMLSISYLPLLTQADFDHLLWACDVNFVRGEDSVVRALWAGKPFIWHIYPQDDDAHHAKLDAFLDLLDAPVSLRAFHHSWNSAPSSDAFGEKRLKIDLPEWQQTVRHAQARLLQQPDLASQLLQFVEKNR